jgi:RraA family protein
MVERFCMLPTANVSDVMSRLFAGGPRLRPMHRAGVLAGPALTVKTRPGDNLMIHKAIALAQAGDVIVVDAGGDLTNALIGELMLAQMVRQRLGGIVLDGAIRDSAAIAAQDLPVYAAGITHRSPYKDGPGEINVPISLGGMMVEPGDLVLGDEDGIVAVPFDAVETTLVATEKKQAAERVQAAAIEDGNYDNAWVDATLRRLGCEGIA